MKKVLIITYYWPPSGGGGVQRWLKFVKYFREFGWEPVVYTPENPEIPAFDESLLKDIPEGITVLKQPVWEPYHFYKKFTGKKNSENINTGFLAEKKGPKYSEHLAVWIRGNFFIPDARKFWIKPSIKYLSEYLSTNPVDAIISTGPPHSMHMIALGLKERTGIPWIADFRDPWTNIDFYQNLKLSKWADRKHHELEKKILGSADAVTVVSPGMGKDFNAVLEKKYEVIPNGFDAGDMQGIKQVKRDPEKFIISHIGSLTKSRDPKSLWKVLKDLCAENPDFEQALEIQIIGKIDINVTESIEAEKLQDKLAVIEYLPHDNVLVEQRKADVLLLLINDTPNAKLILTGKLFEYLAARRPVICIGPGDGDAAKVLEETNSGHTFGFDETEGLKARLLHLFENREKSSVPDGEKSIKKYERRELTKRMVQVLNSCIVSRQGSD